jgi:hypothetical protein
MNIIFRNWLDINSNSDSDNDKDIISESFNFVKKQEVSLSEEKLEKINTNLKITINDLDKKIESLINENNAYKGIVQILLFFCVASNIIIYSKIKN